MTANKDTSQLTIIRDSAFQRFPEDTGNHVPQDAQMGNVHDSAAEAPHYLLEQFFQS